MQLRDRAKDVAFIEAYAPNESHNVGHNHALWTVLDKIVEETPKNEQLLVLIDANARMPMSACQCLHGEDGYWRGDAGEQELQPTDEMPSTSSLAHSRVAYHMISTGGVKKYRLHSNETT